MKFAVKPAPSERYAASSIQSVRLLFARTLRSPSDIVLVPVPGKGLLETFAQESLHCLLARKVASDKYRDLLHSRPNFATRAWTFSSCTAAPRGDSLPATLAAWPVDSFIAGSFQSAAQLTEPDLKPWLLFLQHFEPGRQRSEQTLRSLLRSQHRLRGMLLPALDLLVYSCSNSRFFFFSPRPGACFWKRLFESLAQQSLPFFPAGQEGRLRQLPRSVPAQGPTLRSELDLLIPLF